MKILIFSSAYSKSGSSIRASLIADGLQKAGATVAVAGYSIPDHLCSKMKSYVFQSDRPGREYLAEAARDFRPDWIFGITDDVAEWVIHASQQINCKAAFDIHAISLFEIIELGKGYGNRLHRLKRALSNLRTVSKASLILTVPPTIHRISGLLWGKSNVVQVTAMVDVALFDHQPTAVPPPTNGRVHVFYIGNYYKWQGVNLFLDAAQRVNGQSANYDFTILGSVGRQQAVGIMDHPMVQERIVNILEPVTHGEVPSYMDQADILVIPRPFMLSTHFAFPSKLGEYMASGKFIIATDLAPHRWALANPACGVLCPPTSKGMASAILEYDFDTAVKLGRSAREQSISRFDHIKQCQKIFEELSKR